MHPPAPPSGIKILYLDCSMGAAGDMLAAALLDLLPESERAEAIAELNVAGIPKTTVQTTVASKCGIQGLSFQVLIDGVQEGSGFEEHGHHHGHGHGEAHERAHIHSHHHASMQAITDIIAQLKLPEDVKKDIGAVYNLLAEAESTVHGVPVTEIHFHEVGNLDAIADIAAVCLLMAKLGPAEIIASPIKVGTGHVHCAHGILPVPAPATALLLRGLPIYGGEEQGELCTPTGAALLRFFVKDFGALPLMEPEAYGYGMGHKDFAQANCVRSILGKAAKA